MIHKYKIDVPDLLIGMYISQLDRPWVETPFMFQGFNIKNPSDIEELGKYCEYVVVDKVKSHCDIPKQLLSHGVADPHKVANDSKRSLVLPGDVNYGQHMRQALQTHSTTLNYVKNIMDDVRFGRSIDIKRTKAFVGNLAENIVKNPTALVWLTQLKNRDEYTSIHSLNVCILTLFFGRSLELPKHKLLELGIGALLHDIGKLQVPLEVLNKPGKLTNEEYAVMKKHTQYGYDLLKNKNELGNESLNVIQAHHERIDGGGYPYGLSDHQISYFTKIVSIVDVYDAVTSKRVYHDGTTPYDALNNIYRERTGVFDPDLVERFIKHLGIYPIGSVVELTTGELGIVSGFNEKQHLTPTVLLILDKEKKPYLKSRFVNLASAVWNNTDSPPRIKRIVNPDNYDMNVADIVLRESLTLSRQP